MAKTPKTTLYTVLCDSRKYPDVVLARCQPGEAGWRSGKGFWTDADLDKVGVMTFQDAQEIVASLSFNNPRVVRYTKALRLLARQIDAGRVFGPDPEAIEAKIAALAATAERRWAGSKGLPLPTQEGGGA